MNGFEEGEVAAVPATTGLRKILRNSATLISARIVSKFATTLFMIILARRLGSADFGAFSSVVAFTAFFSLFEEFGMTQPMIRRMAQFRAEGPAILGQVLGLKLVLGAIAYVALVAVSTLLQVSPAIAAILGLSMIFEVLSQTVIRSFEAYERMRDVAIATVAERVLLCVTGVAAVWFTGSLAMVGVAYVLTFAASLTIAWRLFAKNVGPFRAAFPLGSWRPLLREALPFLSASVLSIVWMKVDIYFLTSFRTPAEVGSYNAALRIVEAQIFIPVAILGSVFPVLARLHGGPIRQFHRILVKNFIFLLFTGLLIASVTWVFAPQIVAILFGEGYRDSATILRVFAPVVVFSFLHYLTSGALVAMGRELLTTLTLGIGATVCVILGFIYIPAEGARAAGLIKVVAEGTSFAIQGGVLAWSAMKSARDGHPA